jgi:hypothetical protein
MEPSPSPAVQREQAGCVYLIERHVTSQTELTGLVAAYVEHSEQACPGIVAQRRQLRALIDERD